MTTLSPTSTTSSDVRELTCNYLFDRDRGLFLPDVMGPFENGFDAVGRPQHVNLATICDYYKKDILAVDRLMLQESNRPTNQPLFPFQRIIIKTAAEVQFLWLQMIRGGSKTYTLARFALDYGLQNANVPIIFTGPSFRQSLLAYDEVLKLISLNARNENSSVRIASEVKGDPKRNSTESIIHFANGSSIRALPLGDGSKVRGIRGGVLILDEFYQFSEEQYELHLKPFVAVKQGGLSSKIIYATTSWYQDCYAYSRLMEIASEVKYGNPDYAILDFNLKDLHDCGFPLDTKIWQDAMRHGQSVSNAMTYFNIWPSQRLRWFEQRVLDYAVSEQHKVRIEHTHEDGAKYFAVVDLAASEKGDSTFIIEYKFEDGCAKAVWAHQEKGLGPSERAWLVHTVDEKFQNEFIIYDSHAAIGVDTRKMLAEKELIVKGTTHKVTPLVHHDAHNLSGKRKLIPVSVTDIAVQSALRGPRDGTTISGELGLYEALFTQLRDYLIEGRFLGPAKISHDETDSDGNLVVPYSGSELEILDTIQEAFRQLGNIGLERDKMGNEVRSLDGRLKFERKAGAKDDGAMCHTYAVIGLSRLLGQTEQLNPHASPIREAMGQPGPVIDTYSLTDTQHIQRLVI